MLNISTRTIAVIALACGLQACSWFREKQPEYIDAPEVPPLKVPEGLDAPKYQSPIVINAPDLPTPTGDELNPTPPRVANTGGGGKANAYMAWSAQGVYLKVKDTPESVARRLGFAIEHAGMDVLDKGEDGRYRFEYVQTQEDDRSFWQKLKFWSRNLGPNYSGIYRTEVKPDDEGARIYLFLDAGKPAATEVAEHVLGIFMDRLG